MWAGGATVDFVARNHVQRKRLVRHRLFQQDETALWRVCGVGSHLEERDRHSIGNDILRVVHACLLNSHACAVQQQFLIRHIVKLKLTERAYRLTVAFVFTRDLADGFAVDLAGAFDGTSVLLPLLCDASSLRCRFAMISVFSRLTRLSSST